MYRKERDRRVGPKLVHLPRTSQSVLEERTLELTTRPDLGSIYCPSISGWTDRRGPWYLKTQRTRRRMEVEEQEAVGKLRHSGEKAKYIRGATKTTFTI